MDAYSAEGVWWRPEAPQHRVPGTLTCDEDDVQLVVYGPLRPSIPPKDGVVRIEGFEWVATPVVHGRTRDGADITLLDVDGLLSLPIRSAEVRETHTVSVACIGGHFGEDVFIEAQAELDWLDAWLDPPSIMDDVTGAHDEAVVRVGRSELARAEIVGGTVRLITGVAGREGPSAIHLDRWSAVSIDLKEPQPWRTILDRWVRPFHDLLTISIGRPVRLTELRLRPADAGPRAPLCDARFGVVQAQGKGPLSRQALLNYSAPTLVTRRDAGVPLRSRPGRGRRPSGEGIRKPVAERGRLVPALPVTAPAARCQPRAHRVAGTDQGHGPGQSAGAGGVPGHRPVDRPQPGCGDRRPAALPRRPRG